MYIRTSITRIYTRENDDNNDKWSFITVQNVLVNFRCNRHFYMLFTIFYNTLSNRVVFLVKTNFFSNWVISPPSVCCPLQNMRAKKIIRFKQRMAIHKNLKIIFTPFANVFYWNKSNFIWRFWTPSLYPNQYRRTPDTISISRGIWISVEFYSDFEQ